MKVIQRGRASDRVIVMWLELVNTYDKSPKKLLNRINLNKEIKIRVDPLKDEGPLNILNSLWRKKKIECQKINIRLGIIQK